jgi:hypothetical protein
LESVRLEELLPRRGAKQKPRGAAVDEIPQHCREGRAEVNVSFPVLRL